MPKPPKLSAWRNKSVCWAQGVYSQPKMPPECLNESLLWLCASLQLSSTRKGCLFVFGRVCASGVSGSLDNFRCRVIAELSSLCGGCLLCVYTSHCSRFAFFQLGDTGWCAVWRLAIILKSSCSSNSGNLCFRQACIGTELARKAFCQNSVYLVKG